MVMPKSLKDWAGRPSVQEPLPKITAPRDMVFVDHLHASRRQAGLHHDIRVGDPATGRTWSWATKKGLPPPGRAHELFGTGFHPWKYLSFQGPLTGYGQGTVKIDRKETAKVLASGPGKMQIALIEGRAPETFTISQRDGRWYMHNTTPSRDVKAWQKLIPLDRPKYREQEVDSVDMDDERQVLQPKIDGSHCWIRETPIETLEYGIIQIGDLVDGNLPAHVKSWDFAQHKVVWKRVTGYSKRPISKGTKLASIHLSSWSHETVFCTQGHKWKGPRGGEILAKNLTPSKKVAFLEQRPNYVQWQVILGSLLGDASFSSSSSGRAAVYFCHGEKQLVYLETKHGVMGGLANPITKATKSFKGKYSSLPTYRFGTSFLDSFRDLSKRISIDGKKAPTAWWLRQLDALGWAIWFMDDGHVATGTHPDSYRSGNMLTVSLSTHGFGKKGNEILQRYFGSCGLRARIQEHRGLYFLVFPKWEAFKFLRIIASYVLPMFAYKMGFSCPDYPQDIKRIFGKCTSVYELNEPLEELVTGHIYSKRLQRPCDCGSGKNTYVYNIEVEDTHNYFVKKALVGNSVMVLRPGKLPRLFSTRIAKRGTTGVIEHTFKVPGLLDRKSPEGGNTALRGEIYGVDKWTGKAIPAATLGGILNAKTPKSLQMQTDKGVELRFMPYSVERYQGKDMRKRPYLERLDAIKDLADKLPFLQAPETAVSRAEKARLMRRILEGDHPLTREGAVAWDKETGQPTKLKKKPDYDVKIKDVFPSKNPLHAGGFTYLFNGAEGRVGTGFSDKMKKDMLEHPDRYRGLIAKVRAQEVFPSGKLRAPSFREWHLDKNAPGRLEKVAISQSGLKKVIEKLTEKSGVTPRFVRSGDSYTQKWLGKWLGKGPRPPTIIQVAGKPGTQRDITQLHELTEFTFLKPKRPEFSTHAHPLVPIQEWNVTKSLGLPPKRPKLKSEIGAMANQAGLSKQETKKLRDLPRLPRATKRQLVTGGKAISKKWEGLRPFIPGGRKMEELLIDEIMTRPKFLDWLYRRFPVSRLEKVAALKTHLQPYQQRVVERMKHQPGLVVAHGLGSGKTLTSIAAQEALGLPAEVVVPAALGANYMKEVRKHTGGKGPKRGIRSLQRLARSRAPMATPMLIVDEAHRMRDPKTSTRAALGSVRAGKRMLLTASPFYNRPSDIAPLVNVAAGARILPEIPKEFEHRYVEDKKLRPGLWGWLRGVRPGSVQVMRGGSRGELGRVLSKWVDYHPSASKNYPSVARETVEVPMSKKQMKIYSTLMGTAPFWVRYKIKKGLPPSKSEAKRLNAFLSGTRQVSNTTAPFTRGGEVEEPKIEAAFKKLRHTLRANPRSKALVYSNFIGSGLDRYKTRLEKAGIPYGEFTGRMPRRTRNRMVQDYNAGKLRALLVSSAGGEGLDLKGTRLVQLLDPHWNMEKLKQVEGRAIRYKSHAGLPRGQRNVKVQQFLSTRPRTGLLERWHLKKPGGSVDQYLYGMSAKKENLIRQFRSLLVEPPPAKIQ